jgi:hypothetical protein
LAVLFDAATGLAADFFFVAFVAFVAFVLVAMAPVFPRPGAITPEGVVTTTHGVWAPERTDRGGRGVICVALFPTKRLMGGR